VVHACAASAFQVESAVVTSDSEEFQAAVSAVVQVVNAVASVDWSSVQAEASVEVQAASEDVREFW
jgi:hypothetical protein